VVFLTASPATSLSFAGLINRESFTKLVKLCCLFLMKLTSGFSHFLILIFSCLALGWLLISASADLLFQKPIRLLVRDILLDALSLYGLTFSILTITDFTYPDYDWIAISSQSILLPAKLVDNPTVSATSIFDDKEKLKPPIYWHHNIAYF